MGNKKINWKNVLVLLVMVLIGFTAGVVGTFKIVNDKLSPYGIEVKLWG